MPPFFLPGFAWQCVRFLSGAAGCVCVCERACACERVCVCVWGVLAQTGCFFVEAAPLLACIGVRVLRG